MFTLKSNLTTTSGFTWEAGLLEKVVAPMTYRDANRSGAIAGLPE